MLARCVHVPHFILVNLKEGGREGDQSGVEDGTRARGREEWNQEMPDRAEPRCSNLACPLVLVHRKCLSSADA